MAFTSIKKIKIRKPYKIALRITVAIVILLVILQGFVVLYLPGLVKQRIIYLVERGSGGLYQCNIGDVSVNLLPGNIILEDIDIKIDSAVFKNFENSGDLPEVTYALHLEKGSVTGFQLFPFLLHRVINLNTVRTTGADIVLCSHYDSERSAYRTKMKELKKQQSMEQGIPYEPVSEMELWRLIEPEVKGIFVQKVMMDEVKFTFRDDVGKNDLLMRYDNLSVRLSSIRVDSTGSADKTRILFAEDVSIWFQGLEFQSADSLYRCSMDSVIYSSMTKEVDVRGFVVGPTVSNEEFTRIHGQQVDVFNVVIPSIHAHHFRIGQFFTENVICFDTIDVHEPLLKIYHDRTAAPDTVVKYGQYPNEALLRAPFAIRIPVVKLWDGEVHYIEKQAVTYKTGDGFFTHITGEIRNITNDSAWLKRNSHVVIDMTGNLLYSGKMSAVFDFDLLSPNGWFMADAHLGRVDERELNLLTIPFGNLELTSSNLLEAHFHLNGTRTGTEGNLRMIYTDMKVGLYKVNEKKHQVKKDRFMTFLANLLGVRKNNPGNGKEKKAEHIRVSRTPTMPFFNLIWRTLWESMKEIMLRGPAKNIQIGQEE